ncbi:MAG: hypothetical protein LBT55_01725 [Clostridiaceae bacterium]|nr:hypothetical protein [Clostridiaceae bacterium]
MTVMTIDEIATLIEEALECIAKVIVQEETAGTNNPLADAPFKFKLFGNWGQYQTAKRLPTDKRPPKPFIHGGVMPLGDPVVSLNGLGNFSVRLGLELAVKIEWVDWVVSVLYKYAEEKAGLTAIAGSSAAYTMSVNLPSLSNVLETSGIGRYQVVSSFILFQYFAGGVLSNSVQWKINGEEMLVLSAAVVRTGVHQADNVDGSEEMQSVIGQQGVQYNLVIPYRDTSATKEIVGQVFNGGLKKVYKIQYADGCVTAECYALLINGQVNYEAGMIASINIGLVICRSDIFGAEIAALNTALAAAQT